MEHRINSIHKRALKLVHEDSHDLSFQGLLAKDISVFTKKASVIAAEILRYKTGMSSQLMNDTFHFIEKPYNLRSNYTLERNQDYTVYHGSESLLSVLDPLPNSIKNSASLKGFKAKYMNN